MAQIKVVLEIKKIHPGGDDTIYLDGEPQLVIEHDPKSGIGKFKQAKVKGKKVKSKIAIIGPIGNFPQDRDSDKFATVTIDGDCHIIEETINGIFKKLSMTEIPEEIRISPMPIYEIKSEIFFSDGTSEVSEHRIGTTTDPSELSFTRHWSKKIDGMDFPKSETILRKFVESGLMEY
ncbi:hypothetical protein [Methanocella paludicola]|nr:hypothetical protein [Methanocella paludicola]